MDKEINFTLDLAIACIDDIGEGEGTTPVQKLKAWAHIISTGDVWDLSNTKQRKASDYIDSGIISDDGEINWHVYEELNPKKQ